jgi:hypothetical protein
MKPKLGTFVTALLAGTFATAAWAQELGRVHFETSCTPQAQAVNHSSPTPSNLGVFRRFLRYLSLLRQPAFMKPHLGRRLRPLHDAIVWGPPQWVTSRQREHAHG